MAETFRDGLWVPYISFKGINEDDARTFGRRNKCRVLKYFFQGGRWAPAFHATYTNEEGKHEYGHNGEVESG